jgi:predicted peptidase
MAANETQTEELNNQIIELQEKIAQLTTAPVNYGIIDNTDTLSKHEYETETAHFGYWLYMPENAETSEKPLPMIVFLHSGNGTGTNLDQLVNFDYGMARYLYEGRLQPNAVIVMPQSPNGWTKDYDQLFEFITAMADIYNVDKSRISLTGVSRGGIATFEMLLRYDDYFFRAMPIASAGNADLCKNIKTPLWIVHGENDTGMGFSVIDIDRLINENGGTCKLQMLPGAGHTGQYVYYEDPEVMAWLTGEDLNT